MFHCLHFAALPLCTATLVGNLGAIPTRCTAIPLSELARRSESVASYEESGNVGRLQGKNLQVKCRHNSACYCLNGVNIYGQCPVSGSAGHLRVSEQDWHRVLVPLLSPPPIAPIRCVCIDPGHGGSDPGSRVASLGLEEKKLTLDIARRLQTLLEMRGIRCILTRKTDEFIPLKNRSMAANHNNCDLFVSIHFNAADNISAEGIETYILPCQGMPSTSRLQNVSGKDREFFPNNRCDEQNLYLGYCLQKELHRIPMTKDRGLRRGRFVVLESTQCPAALVECGFLTAKGEGQRIVNERYRQEIAQALCDGICAYGSIASRN
ncbi:MAG: N-acetylmuramoyl-L-alanine amidase [Puniceicoccales bacterium]|jgi:N-acetylmuramoyl-L-alanine amidase|nr:N-acetylmuramoyl-L-alanine amidase [Puniceicoccales bacterium]